MLNLIFPDLCVYCKEISPGEDLCKTCFSKINFIKQEHVCVVCGVPYKSGEENNRFLHKCGTCVKKEKKLLRCRSVAYFDGLIRELLHSFKYRGRLSIGRVCAKLLTDKFSEDLKGFDLVLPVPVHIKKLREREFNQSAVLATYLSKKLDLECDLFSLVKSRETEAQVVYKNAEERRKNVAKSFSIRNPKKIKKRSVLLVDDVFTSGSTVNECAGVLLKSGASEVQALTLLRADV